MNHRLTLLELVVMLFVIFVFVAMVMPHPCRARPKARRANCAGNLKQMGVALLMYSGDFNGYFPLQADGNNFEPLNSAGYLVDSKVYACPSTAVFGTTAANSNYWYVGGGYRDDDATASETRLAFDMFGNHASEGKGDWMNVLFIDGHVRGAKPGDTLPFNNNHAVLKAREATSND